MAEKPILFSGPMVRAILDGTKTQARRVVKPKPVSLGGPAPKVFVHPADASAEFSDRGGFCVQVTKSPYGKPGDRLWVRETWADWTDVDSERCVVYQSDGLARKVLCDYGGDGDPVELVEETTPIWPVEKWRPSIHMPRWASRLTLNVTGVRVERVQEISHEDCIREGVDSGRWTACDGKRTLPAGHSNARNRFRALWDSINADRGFGWQSNPWVWVIEFERAAPVGAKPS